MAVLNRQLTTDRPSQAAAQPPCVQAPSEVRKRGSLPASGGELPVQQSQALVTAQGIPTTVLFLVAKRQLAQVGVRCHMCPGRGDAPSH